jgi:hypothetical protein|tara:strand:- start:39 stop:632 length:594 start_codon:yes stop_codon:yes gene_type:complete
MNITVQSNIKSLTKNLRRIHKKQIPFATSVAINRTAFNLRKEYMKQAEKKLDRPTPFTVKSFLVIKATKRKLTGIVYIKQIVQKYLKYAIQPQIKSTGKRIPIPYKPNARLNKFGNIIGKKSGLIKKQSQFIATIKGVNGVWERQRDRSVKLLISFERSVNYKRVIFPFFKIGRSYVKNVFPKKFKNELFKAIKSAR